MKTSGVVFLEKYPTMTTHLIEKITYFAYQTPTGSSPLSHTTDFAELFPFAQTT